MQACIYRAISWKQTPNDDGDLLVTRWHVAQKLTSPSYHPFRGPLPGPKDVSCSAVDRTDCSASRLVHPEPAIRRCTTRTVILLVIPIPSDAVWVPQHCQTRRHARIESNDQACPPLYNRRSPPSLQPRSSRSAVTNLTCRATAHDMPPASQIVECARKPVLPTCLGGPDVAYHPIVANSSSTWATPSRCVGVGAPSGGRWSYRRWTRR